MFEAATLQFIFERSESKRQSSVRRKSYHLIRNGAFTLCIKHLVLCTQINVSGAKFQV